jgi:uncharacterized protein YbjQ (UPF0145 family)
MSVWTAASTENDWNTQTTSRLPLDPAMVSTTETLAGYEIVRSLGVVEGLSTSIFNGLIKGVRSVLVDAMREAYLDMLGQAASHGAQAIVGVRYAAPMGDVERVVMVYGTAVTVRKI